MKSYSYEIFTDEDVRRIRNTRGARRRRAAARRNLGKAALAIVITLLAIKSFAFFFIGEWETIGVYQTQPGDTSYTVASTLEKTVAEKYGLKVTTSAVTKNYIDHLPMIRPGGVWEVTLKRTDFQRLTNGGTVDYYYYGSDYDGDVGVVL